MCGKDQYKSAAGGFEAKDIVRVVIDRKTNEVEFYKLQHGKSTVEFVGKLPISPDIPSDEKMVLEVWLHGWRDAVQLISPNSTVSDQT